DVVEIPLDGSPIVDVIAASADETAGSRTADGQIVYSSSQSGSDEIRVRGSDGFDRPVVTSNSFAGEPVGLLAAPVISPDGQRIVFQRLFGNTMMNWIAPIAGGAALPVTPAAPSSFMPDWSPDGRWIAYTRFLENSVRIVKQRVGSSEAPVVLVD